MSYPLFQSGDLPKKILNLVDVIQSLIYLFNKQKIAFFFFIGPLVAQSSRLVSLCLGPALDRTFVLSNRTLVNIKILRTSLVPVPPRII